MGGASEDSAAPLVPLVRRAAWALAAVSAGLLLLVALGSLWLGSCHGGAPPCDGPYEARHAVSSTVGGIALALTGTALATPRTRSPRVLLGAALPGLLVAIAWVAPRLP
jgi:hypothetical protein